MKSKFGSISTQISLGRIFIAFSVCAIILILMNIKTLYALDKVGIDTKGKLSNTIIKAPVGSSETNRSMVPSTKSNNIPFQPKYIKVTGIIEFTGQQVVSKIFQPMYIKPTETIEFTGQQVVSKIFQPMYIKPTETIEFTGQQVVSKIFQPMYIKPTETIEFTGQYIGQNK
jgi:hypothetical protein